MNIKRIISVCLAFVVVLTALTGCSLSSKASLPGGVDADGRFIVRLDLAGCAKGAYELQVNDRVIRGMC
jgi:hypothetical protein